MRIFEHTRFQGFYPVGVAAIVIAGSTTEAAELLSLDLRERGLPQDINPNDFREIDTSQPASFILRDGDY